MNRIAVFILLIIVGIALTSCTRADEGTVLIETTSTGISKIIRPSNGYVGVGGPGTDQHEFDTKIFTFQPEVLASTKDNAAVKIVIQARILPPQTDDDIKAYARYFGVRAGDRVPRVVEFLSGAMNTETKNAVTEYEAYGLLANQEAIQKKLLEVLSIKLKAQWLKLESIEIIGRPDFVDDRIENAASAVVANQKDKEAAQAALEKAKVEAERKEVEARAFANPATLEIEKLKLQLQIEEARAEGIGRHQGPLTIVNGATPIQLRQQ